jgi:hypothetical protein
MKNQFAVIVPKEFGKLNITIFGTNNHVSKIENHFVTGLDNAKAVLKQKAKTFADELKLKHPSIVIDESSLEKSDNKIHGHIMFNDEDSKYDGTWELQM